MILNKSDGDVPVIMELPIYQPLHKVNFKRSLTGLNSEFSFSLTSCLTKTEEPTILPIAGGRIIEFIPFPRVLVLCEMQSVSSRIWTRIAVSISYEITINLEITITPWHLQLWLNFGECHLLPSLPGPLWSREIAPGWALSMGQI